MSRLLAVLVIVGVVVSAAPTITKLAGVLQPLALTVGVVAGALRILWWYTR